LISQAGKLNSAEIWNHLLQLGNLSVDAGSDNQSMTREEFKIYLQELSWCDFMVMVCVM
jgi:hypothetical protein